VNQSRIFKRLLLVLALVVIAILCGLAVRSSGRVHALSESSAKGTQAAANSPQQLSPAGQASLHAMIQTPMLPELRWPNFSDYDKHVEKFYESYGYSLPWVSNMQPTPQAQQVIAVLLKAEDKGLSADDYDGSRWADRLAKFKSQPSEADAVRFDMDLTVSVMRYVSDLHIGKVNPKHFDFGFDVDVKKYELPEFVKQNVVDASDVSTVLAQVEPPYPGYQRTMQAL
jgi:murein L,D-transpeptidase YcbB/YkuD